MNIHLQGQCCPRQNNNTAGGCRRRSTSSWSKVAQGICRTGLLTPPGLDLQRSEENKRVPAIAVIYSYQLGDFQRGQPLVYRPPGSRTRSLRHPGSPDGLHKNPELKQNDMPLGCATVGRKVATTCTMWSLLCQKDKASNPLTTTPGKTPRDWVTLTPMPASLAATRNILNVGDNSLATLSYVLKEKTLEKG